MCETFEDFYRSQRPPLVRLAHLLCGSLSEAEELAQDAMLAVQQRWGSLDNPHGYARRALVNRVRTMQRRAVLQRSHPPQAPGLALPPEYDETWAAIRAMRPAHRAVLVLRFYEDLPVAEIAELLGRRPGTVKSLLHRALAQLKEDLT